MAARDGTAKTLDWRAPSLARTARSGGRPERSGRPIGMSTAMIPAGNAMTSAKLGQSSEEIWASPSHRIAIHPAGQPSTPATRRASTIFRAEGFYRCDVLEPSGEIEARLAGAGGNDLLGRGERQTQNITERRPQRQVSGEKAGKKISSAVRNVGQFRPREGDPAVVPEPGRHQPVVFRNG